MKKNNLFEEEINFRSIFKKPIRLFGWIFPFYIILILILGIYFAQHLNVISFNLQPVGKQDTTLIKKELVEKKGRIRKAIDLGIVKNPTKELIEKGKELYNQNCQSCHGEKGFGDGLAGLTMNPKPRNFHQKDGWINGRTIDAMFKTINEGISKSGMPSYDYMLPDEQFSIILYIRTFADFPPITDDQLNLLNQQYNLDKDISLPNQIPVSKALNLIIEENLKNIDKINQAYNLVINDSGYQKQFLQDYSYDLKKLLNAFELKKFNSAQEFIQAVSQSPLTYGFKPSVLKINKNQWVLLYTYLNKVLKS